MPKILYKFTSIESALKIIQDQRLKITSPVEFNDPFDCTLPNFELITKKINQSFIKLILGKKQNYLSTIEKNQLSCLLKNESRKFNSSIEPTREELKSKWDQVIKSIRILSMTNSKEGVLMWSHYANNHKGVCLGFRTNCFSNFDMRRIDYKKPHDYIDVGIEKIIDKLFRETEENKKLTQNNLSQEFVDRFTAALTEYLHIKRDEWRYENEIRLIFAENWEKVSNEDNRSFINFENDSIEEVCLGCKISPEDRKRLIAVLESKKFKVNINEAKQDGWRLNFKPIASQLSS